MHCSRSPEDNIKLVRSEINKRKEELRATSSAARRAALEQEIAQAEVYLRRTTRPGRPATPKRVNDARKKLVDAISRNLKTALKAIHKASPTLATFFNTPQKGGFLSTGSLIRFDPPTDARDWDVVETTFAEIVQQDAVIS